jgi:hypothetical protein
VDESARSERAVALTALAAANARIAELEQLGQAAVERPAEDAG